MNKQPFAVLSHILPPSSSGQAIMLYRLLQNMAPDSYILLSRQDYSDPKIDKTGSTRLGGRYFYLPSGSKFKLTHHFPFSRPILKVFLEAFPAIFGRANEITKVLQKERPFCLLACTADLYDIPAAYIACKRCKVPFIPYIFDDYVYQWTSFERLFAWLVAKWVMPRSYTLFGPNKFIAREFKKRYGKDMVVIHNPFALPKPSGQLAKTKYFKGKSPSIVYAGAVYRANADAIQNLVEAIKLSSKTAIFHIFTHQTHKDLSSLGIDSKAIEIHPHVDQSEVQNMLSQADILFLPLAFHSPIPEVIVTSAPSKMGEYLAMAKPILVHAPKDCFLSWYFNHNKCGLVVDKNDPDKLAKALSKLLADSNLRASLSEKARVQAEMDFDIEKIQTQFANIMADIKAKTTV